MKDAFVRLSYGLERRRNAYRIDADFFTEGRIKDVGEILGKFNRDAGNLFRWGATENLKRLLKTKTAQ
jgi:hypothetical protein